MFCIDPDAQRNAVPEGRQTLRPQCSFDPTNQAQVSADAQHPTEADEDEHQVAQQIWLLEHPSASPFPYQDDHSDRVKSLQHQLSGDLLKEQVEVGTG